MLANRAFVRELAWKTLDNDNLSRPAPRLNSLGLALLRTQDSGLRTQNSGLDFASPETMLTLSEPKPRSGPADAVPMHTRGLSMLWPAPDLFFPSAARPRRPCI